MDRFQTNNTLILTDFIHTLLSSTCRVDTVNGKYPKSKKIVTDSNYLRCHALLAVLHFPLETTCSRKLNTKDRYWGQQFWQMKRGISVRPIKMTTPVKVDHLQSWSRVFWSGQTEMVRSIWWTNRNFRNFGLNGKRVLFLAPTCVPGFEYSQSLLITKHS